MSSRLELGQYYGRCIKRLRVHGFLFTENRFPQGRFIDEHSHTYPHFTLMLGGSLVERYADRVLECTEGSVLVVPKGLTHSDQIGPQGAHSLSIEISTGISKRIGSEFDVLNEASVVRDPRQTLLFKDLYGEFSRGSGASAIVLECLAMQVVLGVLRQPGEPSFGVTAPEWVKEIWEAIHSDSVTYPSLAELAGKHEVHKGHVSRAFKAAYGITVGECVRQARLTRAVEQIGTSTDSIADIAIEHGFSDSAHLCRTFKRVYGVSPTEFRQRSKKDYS